MKARSLSRVQTKMINFIFFFVLIYMICPINTEYNYHIVTFVSFIGLFFAYATKRRYISRLLIKKHLILAYIYPLILLVMLVFGRASSQDMELAIVANNMVIMTLYMIDNKKKRFIRTTTRWCLIYLIVIVIYTIYKLLNNPGLLRLFIIQRASLLISNAEIPFVAGYNHVYAFTFLSVISLGIIFKKGIQVKERTLGMLFVIGMSSLLILANYAYPILLLVSFDFLSIFLSYQKNSRRRILIAIFIAIMIPVLIELLLRSNVLTKLNPILNARLVDFFSFMRTRNISSNSDAELRMEKYYISINTFLSNPILGVGYSEYGAKGLVGAHSEILDRFAYYGLLGGSSFLLDMYLIIRNIRLRITEHIVAYTITICCFVAALVINPCYSLPQVGILFVLVPLIISNIEKRTSMNNLDRKASINK